jgi:hypothetical protein
MAESLTIEKIPQTRTALVERQSAIEPWMGPTKFDHTFIETIHSMIKMRQRWLFCLHRAGLSCMQSEDQQRRLMRCPPPAVVCHPHQHPCRRSFCPFCHARKIARLYEQVHAVSKALREQEVEHCIVRYRHSFVRDPLILNQDRLLDPEFWTDVVPRHQDGRRKIRRRYFRDAYFGGYGLAFEPWYKLSPYDHGKWRATHAVIAVMPVDWAKKAKYGKFFVIRPQDRDDVITQLSSAFRYPMYWYSGRKHIIAQLLDLTYHKQLLTTFGTMRAVNDTQSTVSRHSNQAQDS